MGAKPSGGTATVAHLGAFDHVDPAAGELPALVWGTVPRQVPDGTLLAVAVNGRIGAVVPVVPKDRAAAGSPRSSPTTTCSGPGRTGWTSTGWAPVARCAN